MGVVLYYEISFVALIAVALVIGQVPIQIVLSQTLSSLRYHELLMCIIMHSCSYIIRLKAAKVTDERIKVMNGVITGIRVIITYLHEDKEHN